MKHSWRDQAYRICFASRWHLFRFSLGLLLIFGLLLYGFLAIRLPFPIRPVAPQVSTDDIKERIWPALTPEELQYQRWFSDITWRLPKERWDEHWNIGGKQYGLSSIRYQAAFTGYAAAALGMRTPAYIGLTRDILGSVIEHLIDRRAWSYSDHYWDNGTPFPDPCAFENVMYTGHLLQLLALYEALTGDDTYRTKGFDLAWNEDTKVHYDVAKLIDVSVRQMHSNPSGGIPCEPGLIFFPCNNHPQVALALMEKMGAGVWGKEREKWEAWALGSYRALAGEAAFRIFYHQPSRTFAPIGFLGADAWSLLWYVPWATNADTPRQLWQRVRQKFDPASLLSASEEPSGTTSSCCGDVVPLPATISFLAPAARACGDPVTAEILDAWLDRKVRKTQSGGAFVEVDPEWQIGVTANRALSLALAKGSDLRQLVQNPLPREYFRGPLLLNVHPASASVLQAYRQGDMLVLELDGHGSDVSLRLANVATISTIEGLSPERWRFEDGMLHITRLEQLKFSVVPGSLKTNADLANAKRNWPLPSLVR